MLCIDPKYLNTFTESKKSKKVSGTSGEFYISIR